jgi:hypothetical protein
MKKLKEELAGKKIKIHQASRVRRRRNGLKTSKSF